MAEQQRFRALSLYLVIAWVVVRGTAENNAPERGKSVRVFVILYNTESMNFFSQLFITNL